jgi:hypothetical protein
MGHEHEYVHVHDEEDELKNPSPAILLATSNSLGSPRVLATPMGLELPNFGEKTGENSDLTLAQSTDLGVLGSVNPTHPGRSTPRRESPDAVEAALKTAYDKAVAEDRLDDVVRLASALKEHRVARAAVVDLTEERAKRRGTR